MHAQLLHPIEKMKRGKEKENHLGRIGVFPVLKKMLLSSSFDNLVVDVGNVDLVEHVVAEVISENPANYIEGDVRS